MKKVFITGSQGFVAKNLIEAYRDVYDIYAPNKEELDLCDEQAVGKYIVKHEFDIIIHSANRGITYEDARTSFEMISSGLRMFYNIEKCHDYYGKMIYFGSGAEYGRAFWKAYMSEDYFGEHIPDDAYGLYKYTLSKYAATQKNIIDLRLFSVCGKYEKTYRFLSSNICRALKGMPLTLTQNAFYDYIDVADLAKIVKWFINNDSQYAHYNVCRGQHIDLYSLAVMIRNMLCPDREIIVKKEGLQPEYSGNNSRLLNEIGKFEFIPYQQMIEKLVCYYEPIIETVNSEELP